MKYDKKRQFARLVLCVISLGLVACGGNVKKTVETDEAPPAPKVVSTKEFLPVDSFGKEGEKLPYVAELNPYLEKKGRINKESVAKYIEARRAFKAKEYSKSKLVLEKLVVAGKGLSGPWVMLGDIAFAKGEFQEAIKQYESAIQVNEKNINAYLRLALAERELGKYVLAQNTYAKLLSLWKDFPEAHLNLAILYDLYFNEALKAQQHMEAYQFLSTRKNGEVDNWLAEIRGRTGVNYSLEAGLSEEPPLSVAGGLE